MFRTRILAAGFALGCCGLAGATGQGGDQNWAEARSLRELPAGIQVLLGVGLPPQSDLVINDGIADRGDPYNGGDAIVDNLPRRRFALGIVNGTRAMVAVERGGRGRWVQAVEFRQTGPVWDVVRCASVHTVPQRAGDLLQQMSSVGMTDRTACNLPGQVRPMEHASTTLKQRPGA